jgi:hypothetical protein
MNVFNLSMKKYSLSALGFICVLSIISMPASAQYLRNFKKDTPQENAEPAAEQSAPTYSPYVRNQQQQQAAQPQPTENPSVYEQMNIGNALMKSFAENAMRQGQDRDALNADAPQLNQLPALQTLPDDPTKYCADYDEKNPTSFFSKTASENLLSERIKPVEQMNFNVTKSCLNKVKEIAEQMLVDYSEYKRNDLLFRARKNPETMDMISRKANDLARANVNFVTSARSECALSRNDGSGNAFELNDMVDSCVIQMLKKRIQLIASM